MTLVEWINHAHEAWASRCGKPEPPVEVEHVAEDFDFLTVDFSHVLFDATFVDGTQTEITLWYSNSDRMWYASTEEL